MILTSYKSNRYLLATMNLSWILAVFIIVGCQGPIGPSGLDIQGIDVVPPTIELTSPWPLSEVWDEFKISAAAVDNVAIREVVFSIDGSAIFGGEYLSDTDSPYSKTVRVSDLDSGWHFISARAFDTAGNITDTPAIPVRVGLSEELKDTVVVGYHNSIPEVLWALPDSLHSEAYWVRFTKARTCSLFSVSMKLNAVLSDTALVSVEIWTGDNDGTPEDSVTSVLLFEGDFEDTLKDFDVDFKDIILNGDKDLFVVLSLLSNTAGDTLYIAADSGEPAWNRSGSKDEEGHHLIYDRYSREDNFIMNCVLFYEDLSDTSAGD